MDAIELLNVSKTFSQTRAVDDLSFVVPQGTICGVIGPNGSGKTTTLRMIMRIYEPDKGIVRVLGADHGRAADDRVTYLPEERMLYKNMRVGEVLKFLSQLKGYTPGRQEIDEWLEKMQLPGVARRRVQTLSKGQSQKIQLIAVLISRPEMVLLDEPFSGLDPVNAVVLRDAVLDLKRQGTTVIFSTHDMAVAERMCDTILMIYQGRKVLDGTLEQIRKRFGQDILRIRYANHITIPSTLPGVSQITDFGRYQELRYEAGLDTQALLAQLMKLGQLELFEIAHPSLHDIFVRIADPNELQSEVALA